MRFMMIIRSDAQTEAGVLPSLEDFEAMGKYNEELINAGVLLAADGLHPSSEGAMVSKEGGKVRVVDGPFAESKELIAGFWIITAKDKQEAMSWAKRIPLGEGGRVEVRRVYEAADFADVLPPEQIRRFEAQQSGTSE
jgi:hypothetical protein